MSTPTAGPRVKRDCVCPRARHAHATWLAYCNDKCRCAPCSDAWAVYTRERRRRIAEASWSRWPLYVSPHSTMLRLQALATLGYGAAELATLLGTDACVIEAWRNGKPQWIFGSNAARVAALYDQLWDVPSKGRYAVKVTRLAARKSWLPPLALDDDVLNDPHYTHSLHPNMQALPLSVDPDFIDEIAVEQAIAGRRVRLTSAERAEAVRRLTAAGFSGRQIAERLHVSDRTVTRRRAAA